MCSLGNYKREDRDSKLSLSCIRTWKIPTHASTWAKVSVSGRLYNGMPLMSVAGPHWLRERCLKIILICCSGSTSTKPYRLKRLHRRPVHQSSEYDLLMILIPSIMASLILATGSRVSAIDLSHHRIPRPRNRTPSANDMQRSRIIAN